MSRQAESQEYIEVHNDLRSKVREIRATNPNDDPVKRAEAALQMLSRHFDSWMGDEIAAMLRCREAWTSAGYPSGPLRDDFYRTVHDLKGQATTLGFPLASKAAGSLCNLLDRTPPGERPPAGLLDSHVEAIRAIFREKAKDEADRVGSALIQALDEVTGQYVAEHGTAEDDLADDITV